MNFIENFFFWCSGADVELLKTNECRNDRSKYFGVGTAVFFTGMFAAIAASFALTFIMRTGDAPLSTRSLLLCIGIGIFWGLLIFSLDRFIVASIKKSSSFFWQCLQALPRVLLAIIIGLVIAMPLELKIFEKEINVHLEKMHSEELINNKKMQESSYEKEFDLADKKFSELKEQISLKNTEKAIIESSISKLPFRTCTGKNNEGNTYTYSCRPGLTALKDKLAAKIQEISDLQSKVNESFSTTDTITGKISASNDSLDKVLQDGYGLDKRIQALFSLDTVAHWFVMCLFILVELTPVLTKILLPKGTYDILLESQEKEVSAEAFYRVYEKNARIHENIARMGSGDGFLNGAAQSHKEGTQRIYDQLEKTQTSSVEKSIPDYVEKG